MSFETSRIAATNCACLGHRDQRIVHPVQDEERRGVGSHPGDRRRIAVDLQMLGQPLLDDQPLQHDQNELPAARPLGGEPVVSAVDRNRCDDRCVGVLETGLVLRVIGRQRGQRGQMPACRAAGDRHEVGVAAVFGDVFLDPGQRALDVDDVVGPGVHGAHPVADGDADPSAFGHPAHQRIGLRTTHADRPRAARHLQQHRGFAVTREVAAAPDVGEVGAVRAVPDDVGLLHIPAPEELVRKHMTEASAPDRLRLRGDGLVVVAEGVPQRCFEVRLRRHIAAMDEVQQTPGDRLEQQGDSPATGCVVTPQPPPHRAEHRAGQVQRRHLGGRPAREERRDGGVAVATERPNGVGGVRELDARAQKRPAFTHCRPLR